MAETYSQLISTQDSCKYIYFNNWLQNVPTDYRLNSLVQLLQQLVTVHRPTTQPYTVALTTGYSVPATQPCTLASTTGFRVYWQVPTSQSCTLASITGYRVYRLVLATQPCTLASTYRLQVYKQGAGYTVLNVQGFTPNWLHRKSWLNIDQ